MRRLQSPSSVLCPSPLYPSARKESYRRKSATSLSLQDANKIFNDMASHTELAFGFTYDGCAARSHEMSRLMLLDGVKPLMGFVWIDENKKPRLRYRDPQDPKKNAEWTNHQAPVILVKEGKKITPYVIDPSTQSGPVPFEKWKKTFSAHDKKMKVDSEIGDTGQYAPGSPYLYDYNDTAANATRAEKLRHLQELEKRSDGVELYQSEMMMEQENNDSKLDAMSSGN